MSGWAGPYFVIAVLLAAAGVAKMRDPQATVGALRGMGLRVPPVAVRVGGAVEVVVGLGAIVSGNRGFALAVAASYLAFSVFVAVALVRRLPIGSCGCFGRTDTPPSALHLLVNAGAVAVALAVAGGRTVAIDRVVDHQPLAAVPFLLLVAVGVYAVFTLLTVVPQLTALTRERSA